MINIMMVVMMGKSYKHLISIVMITINPFWDR